MASKFGANHCGRAGISLMPLMNLSCPLLCQSATAAARIQDRRKVPLRDMAGCGQLAVGRATFPSPHGVPRCCGGPLIRGHRVDTSEAVPTHKTATAWTGDNIRL
jgi:hypothetical protein